MASAFVVGYRDDEARAQLKENLRWFSDTISDSVSDGFRVVGDFVGCAV